ncbi:unnamed protein product [Pleuronectes platessa]|uniref:Uncharacterized protein n=1 Tax=Pleuronectes platessa TaxID=8262 RepID=A0A9N7VQC8_PLEPL|nr:unnamed protein product [Pleuronectes platessa]
MRHTAPSDKHHTRHFNKPIAPIHHFHAINVSDTEGSLVPRLYLNVRTNSNLIAVGGGGLPRVRPCVRACVRDGRRNPVALSVFFKTSNFTGDYEDDSVRQRRERTTLNPCAGKEDGRIAGQRQDDGSRAPSAGAKSVCACVRVEIFGVGGGRWYFFLDRWWKI